MRQIGRSSRSTFILLMAFAAMSALWALQPAHAEGTVNLGKAEVELLESGAAVQVLLDADTGDVLSIKEQTTIEPSGVVPHCSGARACWQGHLSPHVAYGFNGTGATGTWANRGTFNTASYTARVCWAAPTLTCSSWYGPSSTIGFDRPVTGKQVQLR